ncbi:MAG TPA: TIGR03668 family PPOX class F420-dependent oxidoreductase [Candidatus Dormibacteraeota bacterium]|nr:TIGR03668 family PPOX class F420-dependent oxidoreductase [Candidatus Dormibacteraeota bacterium]
MESDIARRRLAEANVARLATAGNDRRPHIVPIVFAIDVDTLYFAVDAKPKQTKNLKRLKNIAANPAVSVLVDHYEGDWTRLWWVRVDGKAHVVSDDAQARRAIDLLVEKYAQYRNARPEGPVVGIGIDRITGWSFNDADTENLAC